MDIPYIRNSYDTAIDATVDAHVLGLLSASSPLSYNNVTGQFTIQQSSGAQAGFLSAADWTTFNGKQNALTLGNFTEVTSSVLTITGGTGAIIGAGLTVAVANAAADGATKGVATFNATNFSASAGVINTIQDISTTSSPTFHQLMLTANAGFVARLQAGGSQSGSLTFVLPSNVPAGGTSGFIKMDHFGYMSYDTTSYQPAITWHDVTAASTKITLGGTPAGSVFSAFSIDVNEANLTLSNMGGTLGIAHGGTNNSSAYTAGSVIFSNGTSLTQDNAKFFWDDTAFALCIGTTTQQGNLTLIGTSPASGAAPYALYSVGGTGASSTVGSAGGGQYIRTGTGGNGSAGAGGTGGDFSISCGLGGSGTSGNILSNRGGSMFVTAGGGGTRTGGTTSAGQGGVLSFNTGTGGTNSSTGSGGVGGLGSFTGGPGGQQIGTVGSGGAGGTFSFTGGQGGQAALATGGAGGNLNFTGGLGGGASVTSGAGGNVVFTGGAGGNGSTNGGAGGNVQFIPGAATGAAANGSIIFGSAAGNVVNFIAGSGAAAPATNIGVAIVNYYGSSATNFLGDPRAWLSIQVAGAPFLVPLY